MIRRIAKFFPAGFFFSSILVCVMHVAGAAAAEIRGIRFDDQYRTANLVLPLRGLGTLKYMMVINVYVAALYLGDGVPSEAVLSDTPKRLLIHYFRDIEAKDFARSTETLIMKNVGSEVFERLRPRIARLNALYEDVQEGDRYSLAYIPGTGTEIALNGISKGVVVGADLARAVFSIWFGASPLDTSLKKTLLGKP
jgi:long-chain acyl-CoA synthetase